MDPQTYSHWRTKLMDLSSEQLADLQKHIKAQPRYKASKKEEAVTATYDDWLFDGLAMQMRKHGLLSNASARLVAVLPGYKNYADVAGDLRSALEKLLPDSNKKQLKWRLSECVYAALSDWCRRRNIPRTANTILINSPKAIEALNESFPGYIASGLFHMVLQRN